MFSNDLTTAYRGTKWALVLRGLLGLAVGVFIFARPLDSVAALALVIAFWALFDGGVNIVRSFELRQVAPHWWVMLLAGVVSVIFGVAALYYYPVLSLAFAIIWTAWWLISAGVLSGYIAIEERRYNLSWGWTMAFGIVAFAGGVLAVIFPAITLAALMGLIAAIGFITGVVMLVGAGKLQAFQNEVNHTVRNPART